MKKKSIFVVIASVIILVGLLAIVIKFLPIGAIYNDIDSAMLHNSLESVGTATSRYWTTGEGVVGQATYPSPTASSFPYSIGSVSGISSEGTWEIWVKLVKDITIGRGRTFESSISGNADKVKCSVTGNALTCHVWGQNIGSWASETKILEDSPDWNIGDWKHIAITYSALNNEVAMYVNGIKQTTTVAFSGFSTSTFQVDLSKTTDNGLFAYDEFAIWNRAKTEVEIYNDYVATMIPLCTPATQAEDCGLGTRCTRVFCDVKVCEEEVINEGGPCVYSSGVSGTCESGVCMPGCTIDSDCVSLTDDYCNGDLLIHDTGRCVNYECIVESDFEDCNSLDVEACVGNKLSGSNYYCSNPECALDTALERCSSVCGAGCEVNSDCADTSCDALNGCYGVDYRDYEDTVNLCLETCECENNECGTYLNYPNDNRCIQCATDADCSGGFVCESQVCVEKEPWWMWIFKPFIAIWNWIIGLF